MLPKRNSGTKAELLQLNQTQFPSLRILLIKSWKFNKLSQSNMYTTFKTDIINSGLSFFDFQLFY